MTQQRGQRDGDAHSAGTPTGAAPSVGGAIALDLAGRAFIDAPIPAALVSTAGDGPASFLAVNRAFCAVLETGEACARDLVVNDVLLGFDELVRGVLAGQTGSPVSATLRLDGYETPALLCGTLLSQAGDSNVLIIQIMDASRNREVERALWESEKRMQDLVDHVPALIFIKAKDGSYLVVNRHFERLLGVTRAQVIGCTNGDFFSPDIASVYGANDQKVVDSGVPMEFEEPFIDGGTWLSLKFPLFDMDGNIYAVGGISTDITNRSRTEALIRRRQEAAEHASQAKSEFLSRVSHELRTPLNSILGFGQLIQMDRLLPATRKNLDRIVTAGEHLLSLINELLEISKIEAQSPMTNLAPVDICGPLTEAVELVRPLAQERNIEIVQDLHGGLYRSVLADEQRLRQVMLNVLSNAIKYNRIGGRVTVYFREEQEALLRLCVEDTGFGISLDERSKVFEPFQRLGRERTGTPGTGLGLALSRTLIEGMGGRVDIERSVESEGTTFFIELPLADASPVVHASVNVERLGSTDGLVATTGTVLYVEDNLSNLDLVNGLLARLGNVRLISAVQGQLGIELAAQHQPDLILLDLQLPDLDGEGVLRRLRGDERTAEIPVIVLSADATPTHIDRLRRRWGIEYMTKPLDVPAFLDTVQAVLGKGPSK